MAAAGFLSTFQTRLHFTSALAFPHGRDWILRSVEAKRRGRQFVRRGILLTPHWTIFSPVRMPTHSYIARIFIYRTKSGSILTTAATVNMMATLVISFFMVVLTLSSPSTRSCLRVCAHTGKSVETSTSSPYAEPYFADELSGGAFGPYSLRCTRMQRSL